MEESDRENTPTGMLAAFCHRRAEMLGKVRARLAQHTLHSKAHRQSSGQPYTAPEQQVNAPMDVADREVADAAAKVAAAHLHPNRRPGSAQAAAASKAAEATFALAKTAVKKARTD